MDTIEPGWYAARWRAGQQLVIVQCARGEGGAHWREEGDSHWREDRPLGGMVGPFRTRVEARRERDRINREVTK